jgi:hypothetical protein
MPAVGKIGNRQRTSQDVANLERRSAAVFHYMESGYGERREIGRFAKVDFWKAKLAERFDPEGNKNPWRGAEVSGAFQIIGLERIR